MSNFIEIIPTAAFQIVLTKMVDVMQLHKYFLPLELEMH